MTSDKELLKNGYKEFKPGPFTNPAVIDCFQKRFDDETGKRYFITVNKWSEVYHPHTHEPLLKAPYEFEVQLYKKDTHDAVNLLFHTSWELKDVEEYAQKLWETGLFDYYEEFD